MKSETSWIEISSSALKHNSETLRNIIGPDVLLAPCVKANAYGHGLIEASQIFLDAGADWLCVDALYEARALRRAGITAPIYVLGYVPLGALAEAVTLDLRFVVYTTETIRALGEIKKEAIVHLKVETGTHRQGNTLEELQELLELIRQYPHITVEGISTHFANIEDTLNTDYYEKQLATFRHIITALEGGGASFPIKHCSASAATMLFPENQFTLVRPGIACYGLWPSHQTKQSVQQSGRLMNLHPALSWKTRIAQIKHVTKGSLVGYGCSYTTTRDTIIAILPVGYYDGYDRGLSNRGAVLVRGRRAPIIGRVCMNICMVDITECSDTELEDEATLIGKSEDEEISAEEFSGWADTISYEVIARINDHIPRIFIE